MDKLSTASTERAAKVSTEDMDSEPFAGIQVSSGLVPKPTSERTHDYVKIGPWETAEAFEMRRIRLIRDKQDQVVAYRPVIQQGYGPTRRSYSTVFRISGALSREVALQQAMEWRDAKESELGLSNGARTQASAAKVVPGLSLVVTKTPPYRAAWSSPEQINGKRVRVYIGRRGYQEAYEIAVIKLAKLKGMHVPMPIPRAPYPQTDQYDRLQQMNVPDLPDRRKKNIGRHDCDRRK